MIFHSSRGVLPAVVCRCVWSRNHKNPREWGGGEDPLEGYLAKKKKWDDIIRSLHVIIRLSSHYQQTPCHYQSIETLPEESMSLSEYSHIISTVSMLLPAYRHIISRLHVIIRVSKHFQQTLCHYQSIVTLSAQFPCCYQRIVTLSADSMSLSEYRNIFSRLCVIIRV